MYCTASFRLCVFMDGRSWTYGWGCIDVYLGEVQRLVGVTGVLLLIKLNGSGPHHATSWSKSRRYKQFPPALLHEDCSSGVDLLSMTTAWV